MRYGLILQLTSLIRLIVDSPGGLSILIGTVPPPSAEEIREILDSARPPIHPTQDATGRSLRVSGGKDYIEADVLIDGEHQFNRVIARAGGWAKINRVTVAWAKHFRKRWDILVDYAVLGHNTTFRLDGSNLEKLAAKHFVSQCTLRRIVQIYPQELATAILNYPYNNIEPSNVERLEP